MGWERRLLHKVVKCRPHRQDIHSYIVFTLWLDCNITIFAETFWKYSTWKEYHYLRHLTNIGLSFSRASATVILFNSALLLLLLSKNLLSTIKGISVIPHSVARILDSTVIYHRILGITICVSTLIHVAGHLSNFTHIVVSCASKNSVTQRFTKEIFYDTTLKLQQSEMSGGIGKCVGIVVKTIAFITGFLMCIILGLIVISSRDSVRRNHYNVFWYIHNFVFVLYFLLLCLHAMGGFLKYQTNVNVHDPTLCLPIMLQNHNATSHPHTLFGWDNATKFSCLIAPKFTSISMNAWRWVCFPLLVYTIERCVRVWRAFQSCKVTKLIKHSSHVLEIQLQKKGFTYGIGEYIFLLCPQISSLEWHPFSLTSHHSEEFFSVHIRIVGDWTRKLAAICEDGDYDIEKCDLRLVCDGPYKSPTSNVGRYQTIVCIGANIGITPFVSVLKSFLYQQCTEETGKERYKRAEKVYFYWICPNMESFEWFKDLLQTLEEEMKERGNENFIVYNLHLTRGSTTLDIRDIVQKHNDRRDSITGLYQKTSFGRPMWGKLFEKVSSTHQGCDIGVFYCGSKGLAKDLDEWCHRFSDSETKFYFNQEYF